jgi:hypothetical protein
MNDVIILLQKGLHLAAQVGGAAGKQNNRLVVAGGRI